MLVYWKISTSSQETRNSIFRCRLRGVSNEWKRYAEGIYSTNNGESTPRSEGVSWYSAAGITDPKNAYDPPWWIKLAEDREIRPFRKDKSTPIDVLAFDFETEIALPRKKTSTLFGKHTGMVSRMVSQGGELGTITGFGNLDYVDDNDTVAAAENNWQLLTQRKTLDMRVSVLETNDKVVMDLLKELAFMSLSVIGVEKGRVKLKP